MTNVRQRLGQSDHARSGRRLGLGAAVGVVALIVSVCPATCGEDGGQPDSPAAADEASRREAAADRGPVRVTAAVEPSPARLSDDLTLTVTIDSAGGVAIRKCDFASPPDDFLVRASRDAPPRTEGGREVVERIYTLEPLRAGRLAISPVGVTFVDARSGSPGEQAVQTGAIEVEIAAALAGDAGLESLRPAAGPLELAEQGGRGSPWPLATAVAALAAATLAWWWLRRRAAPGGVSVSPQDDARQELRRLLGEDRSSREMRDFYVDLTRVVRRYLEETTGIRALEQTTEECVRTVAARKPFSPETAARLKGFLESADLVKYAAYVPSPGEVDESVERARSLVELPLSEGDA